MMTSWVPVSRHSIRWINIYLFCAKYSRIASSIPLLPMTSPGHQQQWFIPHRLKRPLSSKRKYLNYLCHICDGKYVSQHKGVYEYFLQIYFDILPDDFNTTVQDITVSSIITTVYVPIRFIASQIVASKTEPPKYRVADPLRGELTGDWWIPLTNSKLCLRVAAYLTRASVCSWWTARWWPVRSSVVESMYSLSGWPHRNTRRTPPRTESPRLHKKARSPHSLYKYHIKEISATLQT